MKKERDKELLVEQLKKTPVIEIACSKIGISRATYYRWHKEDAEFAKQADAALLDGILLINDMAESQLISTIKEKNLNGIIFWLKNHHPTYTNRLEINGKITHAQEELTPEQEEMVQEALKLASLVTRESMKKLTDPQDHGEQKEKNNHGLDPGSNP